MHRTKKSFESADGLVKINLELLNSETIQQSAFRIAQFYTIAHAHPRLQLNHLEMGQCEIIITDRPDSNALFLGAKGGGAKF